FIIQPPPRSTLLPYTTLFRSQAVRPARCEQRQGSGSTQADHGKGTDNLAVLVGRGRYRRTDCQSVRGSRLANPLLAGPQGCDPRSEEHTSELQSRFDLVCRLL